MLIVTNPLGAVGSLPNLSNASYLPPGETYHIFTNDSEGLKLIGMGHIIFNINDFKLIDFTINP